MARGEWCAYCLRWGHYQDECPELDDTPTREPLDLRREPLDLEREPRTLPRLAMPRACAETLALLARAASRHAQRRQYAAEPVALTDFGVFR